MPQPREIDAFNRFTVGVHGATVVIGNPQHRLTRKDAILLAAYLVEMADAVGSFEDERADHLFAETLKAVRRLGHPGDYGTPKAGRVRHGR